MQEISIKSKKKLVRTIFIVFAILIALTTRIVYIQFIDGSRLQQLAYEQQIQKRTINAKRGIIYDGTKKYKLAISNTTSTITINPTNIASENKEKVSKIMSDIFELDYETVLKKVKKRSSIETIAKKVEEEKADKFNKHR